MWTIRDKKRIGALLKYTRKRQGLKQQAFIMDRHHVPICSLRTYIKIENGEEVKNDDFYELLLKHWHLHYTTNHVAEMELEACFSLLDDLLIYDESESRIKMQEHLQQLTPYEIENDYYHLFHQLIDFLLLKNGDHLERIYDAFEIVSLFGEEYRTPFYFALNEINVMSQLDPNLTRSIVSYLRQNHSNSLENRFIQLILNHYEGKHFLVMQKIGDLSNDLFHSFHWHAWLTCLQLQTHILWRIDSTYVRASLLPQLQQFDDHCLDKESRISFLVYLAPLLWTNNEIEDAYDKLLTLRNLSLNYFLSLFPLYMKCKEGLGLPIEAEDFNLTTEHGNSSYYLAYDYYKQKFAGQLPQILLKYLYQDVFASMDKGTVDPCIWRILWDEMAGLCQETESYKYFYLCYTKYAHAVFF